MLIGKIYGSLFDSIGEKEEINFDVEVPNGFIISSIRAFWGKDNEVTSVHLFGTLNGYMHTQVVDAKDAKELIKFMEEVVYSPNMDFTTDLLGSENVRGLLCASNEWCLENPCFGTAESCSPTDLLVGVIEKYSSQIEEGTVTEEEQFGLDADFDEEFLGVQYLMRRVLISIDFVKDAKGRSFPIRFNYICSW